MACCLVLLLSSVVQAAQPGPLANIDPDVLQLIHLHGKARVVVALQAPRAPLQSRPEAIAQAASRALASVSSHGAPVQVHERFRHLAALVASVDSAALSALALSPAVVAIEADAGGYGLLAERVPVNKLDRVAILDTGIPWSFPLDRSEKARGQACFCESLAGAGCCPDGGRRQTGPDSAREELGFPTTAAAWIQIPDERQDVVSWDPQVDTVKVLNRRDRFETWLPVFAALDALLEEAAPLNRILLSFASSRLYDVPAGRSCAAYGAVPWVLRDALNEFAGRGIEPLLPRATGGPGSGVALPGCLAETEQVLTSRERLPLPDPAGLPGQGISGGAVPGGPPPAPFGANGSAALGVVESVTALPDALTPAVDTVGEVRWMRVRVLVTASSAVAEGLANRLVAGRSVDLDTTENTELLLPGRRIKFTAVETGWEGRSSWVAANFRSVAPVALRPAGGRRGSRRE